ncbi:hypothetical protein IFT92_18340 [Peribacillus simplex]|uniref:hypothetical protein n=1 Tax=Peribacillus simplex TaxID=1478 RepID=UPI001920ADFC|nr:hypothetical protein [Peribacillus simplex]MBD8589756.1 hypothetical protein [Peribacillus simplex]
MTKKKFSIFSISCFVVTILLFIMTMMLGHYAATTMSSSDYSSTGFFGYLIFGIMIIAPIIGFILAFKGEKGSLKLTGIIGNLFVFFTISLFIGGVAFFTT